MGAMGIHPVVVRGRSSCIAMRAGIASNIPQRLACIVVPSPGRILSTRLCRRECGRPGAHSSSFCVPHGQAPIVSASCPSLSRRVVVAPLRRKL